MSDRDVDRALSDLMEKRRDVDLYAISEMFQCFAVVRGRL